jgi:hypothetical protein
MNSEDYQKGMWLYWKPKAYYSEKHWAKVGDSKTKANVFISHLGFSWNETGLFEVFYNQKHWYMLSDQIEATLFDKRDLFRCLFEAARVKETYDKR